MPKAMGKFFVCPLQGNGRVYSTEAGQVYDRIEQIADFRLELIPIFCIEGVSRLLKFFFYFIPNQIDMGPIESHFRRFLLDLVGAF